MKKYYVSIIFLFVLMAGFAQEKTVTWISEGGKPVDREVAAYLRNSWQENDSLWKVIDFYPEGEEQMIGTFSDADLSVRHGTFRFFTENGTKTSEGVYDHGVAVGLWNFWYDDGNLMDQGKFLGDISEVERDSIWNMLQEMKNLAPFFEREKLKDGTWEYFHENGVRSGLEQYESGILTEGRYWNADGSEVDSGVVVNRLAEYPGGETGLMRYLSTNIKYPNKARRKRIQGIVYIRFVVDKDGKAKDFDVYESVYPDLDNEALRVLHAMPLWQPGLAQNRLVKVQFNLPIAFRLRRPTGL